MNRRERLILIVTAVVVGLFVLDRYLLTPLLAARTELSERRDRLAKQAIQENGLIQTSLSAMRRWKQMTDAGLSGSAADAENQLLQNMRDWAQAAGVSLSSLKPERVNDRGELREVIVSASASGSMRSVARLLFLVESAKTPARVRRFQLDRRSERSDDLALEIQVSTIYRDAEAANAAGAAKGGRS